MKNLFIFIYSNENIFNDKYTEIIDYYNLYYDNFIIIIKNNNNINNSIINNSIINNNIRKQKLNSYFELDSNQNLNLFILNNLNNSDYDNFVFLYGNLLEYNNNIINDNIINDLYIAKTNFDINNFDLNLNENVFSYNILNKNDVYEIKKKYMIL